MAFALLLLATPRCHAQAALLMEEPYGFFGTVNPTGHTAIYFERICAETPVTLRRCHPGEAGAVVSRYSGINGYDWVAIPLLPYLYSVENAHDVPAHVDRETVNRLRSRYHETQLLALGDRVPAGNFLHGGWTELVGVAYERRIYAFRFATTESQDDAFIAKMNDVANRSHFHLLFNNCSDFARVTLNQFFSGTFTRSLFPDAGMTTPKQIAYKLVRYENRHPELGFTVYEIPQVPGYRHLSRSNKSIAESLVTTGYAIPIAILNPYLAGGLFVDFLVRGRYHLVPKHPEVLSPENLTLLTYPDEAEQNPESAQIQASRAAETPEITAGSSAHSGLKEVVAEDE
jgi:hypothetical protein